MKACHVAQQNLSNSLELAKMGHGAGEAVIMHLESALIVPPEKGSGTLVTEWPCAMSGQMQAEQEGRTRVAIEVLQGFTKVFEKVSR